MALLIASIDDLASLSEDGDSSGGGGVKKIRCAILIKKNLPSHSHETISSYCLEIYQRPDSIISIILTGHNSNNNSGLNNADYRVLGFEALTVL